MRKRPGPPSDSANPWIQASTRRIYWSVDYAERVKGEGRREKGEFCEGRKVGSFGNRGNYLPVRRLRGAVLQPARPLTRALRRPRPPRRRAANPRQPDSRLAADR